MNNPDTQKENNFDDDFEANQNWVGFWNLLLREDIKQNPGLYKNQLKKSPLNRPSSKNEKKREEDSQKYD